MFRLSFFTTVFVFVMALVAFSAPIQPADLELAEVPVDSTVVVPVELESRQETHALEKRRTGKATWFNTGLGACGKVSNDNQLIVALGPMCGKTITVKNTKNGKSTTAKVMDLCPSCGSNNVDLSPAAFKKLGSLSAGVLSISWSVSPALGQSGCPHTYASFILHLYITLLVVCGTLDVWVISIRCIVTHSFPGFW
ncbi:RlpA-like double-psi beta-barrel-protein domain-containing protein-containing protein [Rhizoctonia solani]|nr:RlpA-like double-psi beta-barrel-protein domain-containing protein-containing protein [Rhizoctonia solani]